MHPSALLNAQRFFDTYANPGAYGTVLDIGSQDVNGSIRDVMPTGFKYVGVDFVAGTNVDVVLTDPYDLPFENDAIDIIVSSSCFEHSEMFWLLFIETLRILKPSGLLYMNVPSNGMYHRYPVDCWRFYPDSARALVTWGIRNGFSPLLLESYTSGKYMGSWNDFVGVILKDRSLSQSYPNRILSSISDYSNAWVDGRPEVLAYQENSPDQSGILSALKRSYWRRRERGAMERLKQRL